MSSRTRKQHQRSLYSSEREREKYLLKCGEDTLGTVVWQGSENWHNWGHFTPGQNYEKYRTTLEDAVQSATDTLQLYLETRDTRKVLPIHDFHFEEEEGVYWRWKTDATY